MAFQHSETHPANRTTERLGAWFIANNAGAITWLWAWTHELIAISVLLIFFQLITLIIINLRLRIHDPGSPVSFKIFTQFPFSIYFGWLTLATIANTSSYLVANSWNGFGLAYTPIEWTRIMIGVVVLLTVLVIFTRRNVFFGLVIAWGLYGIILKRQSVDAVMYSELVLTAWIGQGIVIVSCILQFILNITSKEIPDPSPGFHQS